MKLPAILPLLCLLATPATAEEYPPFPPATPFRAEARLADGAQGEVRFDGTWARIDVKTPAGPLSAYIDLPGERAILDINMHGMRMGLEISAQDAGVPDLGKVSKGSAEAVGEDMVAGTPCTLWQMSHDEAPQPSLACVTDGGVPLRVHEGPAATDRIVFEVTRFEPGPQDADAVRPPAGLSTMKVEGLQGLQGLPLPSLR